MIEDHSQYNTYVQAEDGDAGLDLFIGERTYMNRGLGTIILKEFMKRIVFSSDQTSSCIVGPEPNNKRAIRVYEKAGFHYLKTIKIPGEQEPEYRMKIRREEIFQSGNV